MTPTCASPSAPPSRSCSSAPITRRAAMPGHRSRASRRREQPARARGLRVLICGAGLAAALPGAVAAHTDLPVIGVPLKSSLSVLDGLDALLAIAQMPPGVPVAAVGVDNARNAAALAARILGA